MSKEESTSSHPELGKTRGAEGELILISDTDTMPRLFTPVRVFEMEVTREAIDNGNCRE